MLDLKAEALIKNCLKLAIKNRELSGANILILQDGKEVFYHQDGYSNIENRETIKRDTIFRLYSMTKPVTAVAVMILLERGLIDLFDPVSKFYPSFKDQKVIENGQLVTPKREISIKDLLNMTSGLLYPGASTSGLSVETVFKELDKRLFSDSPMATGELVDRLGQSILDFHPGEKWAYGTSADVLGGIVEVVSNKKFGEFLREELFTPLGMVDTDFYVPLDKQDRLATVYETTLDNRLEIYSGNNLGISNKMEIYPAFESGGAGLVSTIDDYSNFTSMLINRGLFNGKTILSPKSVDFLTTQVLDDNQMENFKEWYALSGFTYGNLMRVMVKPELSGSLSSLGEYGWDGWLGCYMANSPKDNLTILVMMQKKDAGTIPFTRKLRNIIFSNIK
ncbi:class A beta-lactamase-related serine hydrolase [Thiospirochaeta perfilievii]|uniref:Class A beta-lactamase-related serine hydrolase n=1 Tax=Thiospirochaeta perfilievii TaxID=252967 RepID=A0A5C1QD23_9SPIO|nr:serine hydrolase domain-containing protein [Thiospirochaeta perfilievii]QEN04614.1 class A beta-lactamase-related serine hydrolase [Thiospirochaeta perfilievii]